MCSSIAGGAGRRNAKSHIFRRGKLVDVGTELIEMLERCAAANGAAVGESTFGHGVALFVGKREVAHLDGPSTLDIRLTKAVIRHRREALRHDDRIELRRNQSDWLEFVVRNHSDTAAAGELIVAAIEANRPSAPEGDPPTPPRGDQ